MNHDWLLIIPPLTSFLDAHILKYFTALDFSEFCGFFSVIRGDFDSAIKSKSVRMIRKSMKPKRNDMEDVEEGEK